MLFFFKKRTHRDIDLEIDRGGNIDVSQPPLLLQYEGNKYNKQNRQNRFVSGFPPRVLNNRLNLAQSQNRHSLEEV